MKPGNAIRIAALAGGTALTATIVLVAPTVGSEVLMALIGAWTVLAVVRVALVVGLTRQLVHRIGTTTATA